MGRAQKQTLRSLVGAGAVSDVLHLTFELQEWVRDELAVRDAVAAVLRSTGYATLSRLAAEQPDLIAELHDQCKLMIEELPWV